MRQPKPFFRKWMHSWYVKVDGINAIKKIVLGKPQAREIYITAEQWAKVVAALDDSDPF